MCFLANEVPVDPPNQWLMLDLGYGKGAASFHAGYRITVMVDDLKDLVHLGGNTGRWCLEALVCVNLAADGRIRQI